MILIFPKNNFALFLDGSKITCLLPTFYEICLVVHISCLILKQTNIQDANFKYLGLNVFQILKKEQESVSTPFKDHEGIHTLTLELFLLMNFKLVYPKI